jgi:hypothetical protein
MGTWQAWTSGKVGNALNFDGIDTFVDLPGPGMPSLQINTIAAWVKFDDNYGKRYVFKKSSPGDFFLDFGIGLYKTDGQLAYSCCSSYGSCNTLISSENYNDNNWHFVVGAYDGSVMKLYVDGNLVNSVSTNVVIFYYTPSATIGRNAVYIGSQASWKGLIDEVRVYSRALTYDEIQALYNSTK